MPRRDAQVHKTFSRLMRSSNRKQPIWYPAMLAYPPSPSPPLHSSPRQLTLAFDLPKSTKPRQLLDKKPLNIAYPEDDLRRQFFRDHPFEAFRARTLVEGPELGQEHEIRGAEWTRLRQRGRNPTPEDCISFALNLHTVHSLPLSAAYLRSISQYRSLRAELSVASTFAALEAEAYGAEFKPTEIERGFALEEKALDTYALAADTEAGVAAAGAKKWGIMPREVPRKWTRGEEYMRKLREGGGPMLMKDLEGPVLLKDSEFNNFESTLEPTRYEREGSELF